MGESVSYSLVRLRSKRGRRGEADPDIYRLGIISSIAWSWLSIEMCYALRMWIENEGPSCICSVSFLFVTQIVKQVVSISIRHSLTGLRDF